VNTSDNIPTGDASQVNSGHPLCVIREDKRGFIPGETPRLLERLAIDPEQFIATAGRMLRQFGSAIGTPVHITELCMARQAWYLRGMGAARALFERRAA